VRRNRFSGFPEIKGSVNQVCPSAGNRQEQIYARSLWIFNRFILETSVVGLVRSSAAAPASP